MDYIKKIRTERIKQWFRGLPQPPVHAEFNPTRRCNLKCKFCLQWTMGEAKNELSSDEWIRIATELIGLGIKTCLISGGEPFSKPEVTIPLIKELKKNCIEGHLATNGTLMNRKVAEVLIDTQWENVIVSVDSSNTKTHDYLRGKKGVFKRVIANIKMLTKLKQARRSSKPNLGFDIVLTKHNFKDIVSIIKLANELKCPSCTFLTLINYNQEISKFNIGKEQLNQAYNIMKDAKILADKLGVQNNLDIIIRNSILHDAEDIKGVIKKNFNVSNKTPICLQPFITIFINGQGIAEPCPSSTQFGVNVREQPIRKVWLSENFNLLRKMILKQNLPDFCSKCCLPKAVDSIDPKLV